MPAARLAAAIPACLGVMVVLGTGTPALGDDAALPGPFLSPAYERSGPDARAALYADPPTPALAAARPSSVATSGLGPLFDPDRERLEALASFGPWLTAHGVSDNARQLVRALDDIDAHGLSAETYGLATIRDAIDRRERVAIQATLQSGLQRLLRRLRPKEQTPTRIPGSDDMQLAQMLEHSFTQLATDLGQGIVDARKTQRQLYRDAPTVDTDALLERINSGEIEVDAALRSVTPSQPGYHRLVAALAELLAERNVGRARTDVPDVGTLWVGHRHDDVMAIKHRLQETGDLGLGIALTPMFDAPLKLAIEAFQSRHGLPASGIVDPRTRAALNTSVDEAITQVAMNLERWRWMPRDPGERHFVMNLPSYRLSMMNGDQRIIDMPVVIGSTEHPTPVFSREMTYLEVNPTWSVPRSIAHRELLPKELARPGYLAQRNFDYLEYRDGQYRKIPYASVTRADLQRRPFPYLLRQRGGADNALGRMKFMMPNPYSIYLHDTQAKSLFTLDERAYSHGCVRLADPEHLLNVVLQIDGHSPGHAGALLAQMRTRRVVLDKPIPTHMAYLTAWVDDDGRLQLRRDVYGHDPALRIALQAAGTLLSEPPGKASELPASTVHSPWQFTTLGG